MNRVAYRMSVVHMRIGLPIRAAFCFVISNGLLTTTTYIVGHIKPAVLAIMELYVYLFTYQLIYLYEIILLTAVNHYAA